jgi:hypothetical protein
MGDVERAVTECGGSKLDHARLQMMISLSPCCFLEMKLTLWCVCKKKKLREGHTERGTQRGKGNA